jgi:3-oxoacyl-[acyl-carrier protein] reductase
MDGKAVSGLLDSRTVVVTGGSRGIGAAICVELAAHGAQVVVNYRASGDAAAAVVSEIESAGGTAIAVQADVEDGAAARELVDAALSEYGSLDAIVNNAYPGFEGGDIGDVDWATYRDSMNSIAGGAIHMVKAALPNMRNRKSGSIINIGTTSLSSMNFQQTPYIVGKGALLALTRGLARDLGPDNIRVNLVSPGTTWVDRTRPQPDDFAMEPRSQTPMGRLPNASEVAGAVVFFASDLSAFITGVHVPVCGGMVMNGG